MLTLLVAGGLLGFLLWQRAAVPTFGPLQPVPLTSYPGEERGGVLSPDGERKEQLPIPSGLPYRFSPPRLIPRLPIWFYPVRNEYVGVASFSTITICGEH